MERDNSLHNKSPEAFRTISEASEEVGVAPHVLRFWEGKFPNLKPLKRAGGRRFYRPQDILLMRGFKRLLQDEGITIRGVQKMMKERGVQSIRDYAAVDSKTSVQFNDFSDDIDEDDVKADEVSIANPAPLPPPVKANPSAASGPILRRALARLEQARLILDGVNS